MEEARVNAARVRQQMAEADAMKSVYGEFNDIMDKVRETGDPSLITSSGIIDKLIPVNEKIATYAQGQFQTMDEARKRAAHKNVMEPAVAAIMGNWGEVKSLLQTQYDAYQKSGDDSAANAVKIMLDQVDNPATRDIVTKTLLGGAINIDPKATDEQVKTVSSIISMPLNLAKLEQDIEAKKRENAGQLPTQDKFKAEADLRKEYTAASKGYQDTRVFYSQLLGAAAEAAKPGSGASGDTALITLFRKVLDPTSVVRETEFAQTAQGGGLLQNMEASVAGFATGQKLTPQQRQDILNTAKQFVEAANAYERSRRANLDYIVNSAGLDAKAVYGVESVGKIYRPGSRENIPDFANMSDQELSRTNVTNMNSDQLKAYREEMNARKAKMAGK